MKRPKVTNDNPAIEHFLQYCHHRRYPPRSEIVYPGDPADSLYYIVDGSVAIVLEDDSGNEIVLTYLNNGEFIGEMGVFIEQHQRSVSVQARTQCTMAEITYERLKELSTNELADDYHQLLIVMGQQVSKRLLQTMRKVGDLAFTDVSGRIAHALQSLSKQPDAITHPDGMMIKITRMELGRIVNCSREMAGRVLKDFSEKGLVSVDGKKIVVIGSR